MNVEIFKNYAGLKKVICIVKPEKKEEEIFITFTSTFALFVVNEDNTLHSPSFTKCLYQPNYYIIPPSLPLPGSAKSRATNTRVGEQTQE